MPCRATQLLYIDVGHSQQPGYNSFVLEIESYICAVFFLCRVFPYIYRSTYYFLSAAVVHPAHENSRGGTLFHSFLFYLNSQKTANVILLN